MVFIDFDFLLSAEMRAMAMSLAHTTERRKCIRKSYDYYATFAILNATSKRSTYKNYQQQTRHCVLISAFSDRTLMLDVLLFFFHFSHFYFRDLIL